MSNERKSRIVLVVEDDPEISSHMNGAINGRGHHTLSATNAQEAIQIAEEHRPLMILTDLQLPTLDELLKLIRSHKTLKKMVIAIVDLNKPDLTDKGELKVLTDFDHLDEFVRELKSE